MVKDNAQPTKKTTKYKMTTLWEDKKIAPLEYCNLIRASKLLECEIEDFLHWFEIGAITLFAKLHNEQGKLVVDAQIQEGIEIQHYLKDDIKTPSKNTYFDYNEDQLEYIEEMTLKLKPNEKNSFEVIGKAGGLWRLFKPPHELRISSILFLTYDDKPKKTTFRDSDTQSSARTLELSLSTYFIANSHITLAGDNIFILKEDIDRIYASAKTGLPISKQGSNVLDKSIIEDYLIIEGRKTGKQSNAIRALVKMILNQTQEEYDLNKAKEILVTALSEYGERKVLPDKNTIKEWLTKE